MGIMVINPRRLGKHTRMIEILAAKLNIATEALEKVQALNHELPEHAFFMWKAADDALTKIMDVDNSDG